MEKVRKVRKGSDEHSAPGEAGANDPGRSAVTAANQPTEQQPVTAAEGRVEVRRLKITKPGIYRGISEADYRADPCPVPSLTQSLAKIIIERAPEHAWTACSRLNPHFEAEDDTKFDIGNAAHSIVLGRGKDFEVIDFDYWSPKAKLAREEAAANGKIAILTHQFEQASDMANALWLKLRKHQDADAFANGDAEVMIAWEEDGIWFRSLIDWLHTDLRTVDDLKTTGMSIAPHVLGMRAEAAGWHIQAAFIERGLDHLDAAGAGRRLYRFVAQETDKPHAVNVMHMDEQWMTMGRKKVTAAIGAWTVCTKLNRWPGYPLRSMTPEYPGFKEKQWLERELAGDFEADPKLIMAG